MFDEKQKRLFNQGYGAYRDIISFCIENISFLHKDNEPSESAALVVMSDFQLQRLLFDISKFPENTLSDAEQTFIKSIVESSSLMKSFIPGYGKFYRKMTPENYHPIATQFEKETGTIHIALTIATKLGEEKRQEATNRMLENLNTVFNSYIALSESNEETKNSIAVRIISQYKKYAISQGIEIVPPQKAKITSDYSDGEKALAALVGLDGVKQDVVEVLNVLKVNEMRKKEGLKPINISKHMVFTGNSGTGKTTVARIIAQIYKENGIVSQGQLIETDRSGLVDTIIGGTAQKVKYAVESAIGGVLFIDEAYALTPEDGGRDFGQEAIATLVKLMEDNKDDLVVIVAGYKKEMQRFIESNPGLKSRFTKYIEFDDYTPEQMQDIFMKMVEADGYTLSSDAFEPLYKIWQNSKLDSNFGNGRGVRNVYEQIIAKQASRMVSKKSVAIAMLTTIEKDDIPSEILSTNTSKPKNKIGFDTL